MLTPEETTFIEFWKVRREQKKKSLRQFTIGLPLGVLILAALFVNVVSGWHKQAAMAMQNNSSLIMVILVATVAIVIFMTVFSQKHEWDQHEQRYQELLQKQNKQDSAAN
jgi:sterol desaturase/sphingolipid hydroxylase (fatty acid hydroxylase superfamily)